MFGNVWGDGLAFYNVKPPCRRSVRACCKITDHKNMNKSGIELCLTVLQKVDCDFYLEKPFYQNVNA